MDVKYISLSVIQLVLLATHLVGVVCGHCPLGYVWSEVHNSCLDCVDVCRHPRALSCLTRCMDTSAKQLTKSLADHPHRHRRDGISCDDMTCPTFEYCDSGVMRCEHCSVICENHAIQGTTGRCQTKCPEYFEKQKDADPRKTDDNKTDNNADNTGTTVLVIMCVSLSLVGAICVALLALGIRYRKKLCTCRVSSQTREDEKKRPLPCSQEGEHDLINSKTPLTREVGPFAEERHYPQPETTAEGYNRNLGVETGFPDIPCLYRVVDGPSTASTIPKTTN